MLRVVGMTLMGAAILGFGLVADDLNHKGELFGVTLVLGVGLSAFITSFVRRRETKLETVKRAIETLKPEELASLREWLASRNFQRTGRRPN